MSDGKETMPSTDQADAGDGIRPHGGVPASAVVTAAVVLGGLATAVAPRHAMSIVQVTVLTAVVAVGLQVLTTFVSWPRIDGVFDRWSYLVSPFRRPPALEVPGDRIAELEHVRNRLSRDRLVTDRLPPLPPDLVQTVQRIARAQLAHQGINPDDPTHRATYRHMISPLTWEIILHKPEDRRKRRTKRYVRADSAATAHIVNTVLDDLDRLRQGPTTGGAPV